MRKSYTFWPLFEIALQTAIPSTLYHRIAVGSTELRSVANLKNVIMTFFSEMLQHVFTIKPERQIRWKKERTSKTNSGRNVRLIISIIQKLRKQSTVPTYNLRVYDYRLLKVLELTKMHLSYKRIFFGKLVGVGSTPTRSLEVGLAIFPSK